MTIKTLKYLEHMQHAAKGGNLREGKKGGGKLEWEEGVSFHSYTVFLFVVMLSHVVQYS